MIADVDASSARSIRLFWHFPDRLPDGTTAHCFQCGQSGACSVTSAIPGLSP